MVSAPVPYSGSPPTQSRVPASGVRPRQLLLTILGAHVLPAAPGLRVPMAAFVALLAEFGVGEHAVRATVQRSVTNGLLSRAQRGRQAYFTLTERAHHLLAEGTQRILSTPPYRGDWDGTWTLLSFSLPESRRGVRHQLRVRLSWNGFGPLRDGLWVAPGRADVEDLLDELALHDHVEVFVAATHRTTDPGAFLHRAWDLGSLAGRYEEFVRHWSDAVPDGLPSDLVREVLLLTEWRLLIRDDPRLPEHYLPDGWPAGAAYVLFLRRYERYRTGADSLFHQALVR